MDVIALHGFLGLASDWWQSGSAAGVPDDDGPVTELRARDLWDDLNRIAPTDASLKEDLFAKWTDFFVHDVQTTLAREKKERPVLLGYSMGGRIAMHAAIRAPELFSAAIFVSANPGLAESEATAREARRMNDASWAERFSTFPWSRLMAEWNGQSVLTPPPDLHPDAIKLDRPESRFKNQLLARGMRGWSLARQKDLRPALARLELPVLFVSGATDQKFKTILNELPLPKQGRKVEIAQAGHRVPWDHPVAFWNQVNQFLNDCSLGKV